MNLNKYLTEPPATLKEAKEAYDEWIRIMCIHKFERATMSNEKEEMMHAIEPTLHTCIDLLKAGKKPKLFKSYSKGNERYKTFKCNKCPKQRCSPNDKTGTICKCGGVFQPHVTNANKIRTGARPAMKTIKTGEFTNE